MEVELLYLVCWSAYDSWNYGNCEKGEEKEYRNAKSICF